MSWLLHRLTRQYFTQIVLPSALLDMHCGCWVRVLVVAGGAEQPRLNCSSFPAEVMRVLASGGREVRAVLTCGVGGSFAVANLLFRFAHNGSCLVRIHLTVAVLFRTVARVTEHTYRKLLADERSCREGEGGEKCSLPCTGSNSTDFSCVHVSNSDVVRLRIEMDLLDEPDSLDFFFFVDVPASGDDSSSSPSSSSSPPPSLSADLVTPRDRILVTFDELFAVELASVFNDLTSSERRETNLVHAHPLAGLLIRIEIRTWRWRGVAVRILHC